MANVSYAAVTGTPLPNIFNDTVLHAIQMKAPLGIYINAGMIRERHLRLYVTMPRRSLVVLQRMARLPGTDPAGAVDFCLGPDYARILLEVSNNPSVFKFYNHARFTFAGRDLSDDATGADAFRNKASVYAVLSERVVFGGRVLPAHIVKWYNDEGNAGLHTSYMDKRNGDGAEMRECFGEYRRQKAASVEEGGIIDTKPYEFMVAYHKNTKYFPLCMHLNVLAKKRKEIEQARADMVAKKCTDQQIDAAMRGMGVGGQQPPRTPEEKKKQRKITRATKDAGIKALYKAAEFMGRHPEVGRLVRGFL